MEKQKSSWLIEPLDAHTNEVFARELARTANVIESVEHFNEKEISVYVIDDYSLIQRLLDSRASQGLRFNVYRRRGRSKPEKWPFTQRVRAPKSQKYKKAKKDLLKKSKSRN